MLKLAQKKTPKMFDYSVLFVELDQDTILGPLSDIHTCQK